MRIRADCPSALVFPRDVIIYISNEFKRSLFKKVAHLMSPRGCLFHGTDETISGYRDAFDLFRSPLAA